MFSKVSDTHLPKLKAKILTQKPKFDRNNNMLDV
jgi:hypothetical protein